MGGVLFHLLLFKWNYNPADRVVYKKEKGLLFAGNL
jgi:hypothetical protein